MIDCEKIIENYIKWMKDNTFIRSIKNGASCEITTPFLDRHNDHLEIFIIKNEEKYKLTDDGYTIADLKISGMEINTPNKKEILKTILNGFGVHLGNNDEIYVEANINNIGEKKHSLLQAILSVNDMYVLSRENIYSLFKEEVEMFFKSNEYSITSNIEIRGKSGISHHFDFIIPSSKTKPERLINTINTINKNKIELSIFHFYDISEVREKTKNYVIYNDSDKTTSSDILSALSNYGISSMAWSKKEEWKTEFALN